MTDDPRLFFNGINLATGEAFYPPEVPKTLFDAIKADYAEKKISPTEIEKNQVSLALDQILADNKLGLVYGYEPSDIEEAGWCLLHPPDTHPEILQALQPLQELRGGKPAMQVDPYISAYDFRKEHGQQGGDVDPEKLPYYMLIVGPPTGLSYEFQHDLDAMHAVGRVDFRSPKEAEAYARKVIEYEKGQAPSRQRRVAIFSPDSDRATEHSAQYLAVPVAFELQKHRTRLPDLSRVSYTIDHRTGEAATRETLEQLLSAQDALIFSISHGAVYLDPQQTLQEQLDLQRAYMGAILCQDWNYPKDHSGITPGEFWPNRCSTKIPPKLLEERMLSGCHIPTDLDLRGLILFSFACYGAGTPRTERFARFYNRIPKQIATQEFSAFLPQRLLEQGALAFIGHVEQVWNYSYAWTGFPPDTGHFVSVFRQILDGLPVGHALEAFNHRYLDLNNLLTSAQGLFYDLEYQKKPVGREILQAWMARQDARGWILFGDPAVRLYPERLIDQPATQQG